MQTAHGNDEESEADGSDSEDSMPDLIDHVSDDDMSDDSDMSDDGAMTDDGVEVEEDHDAEEGIKWIQSKVWQNEMRKHRDDFKIEMGTASWTAPAKRYVNLACVYTY